MEAIIFYCQTAYEKPELHVWDKKTSKPITTLPLAGREGDWVRFQLKLPMLKEIGFKLCQKNQGKDDWEKHDRFLSFPPNYQGKVWFLHGSGRVLYEDPSSRNFDQIRINLITAKKYRNGKVHLWLPGKEGRTVPLLQGPEYPFVDLSLNDLERNLFNFVFITESGQFEEDAANRTWCSGDGPEIWTHSEITSIALQQPTLSKLTVFHGHHLPRRQLLHLWQAGYGFEADVEATTDAGGWGRYETRIYTEIPYHFKFYSENPGGDDDWERRGAERTITCQGDREIWTMEGASVIFDHQPLRDRRVEVEMAAAFPGIQMDTPDLIETRIGEARELLPPDFSQLPDGRWTLQTYPEVTTYFRFGAGANREQVWHRLQVPDGTTPPPQYAVLGRGPLLAARPIEPLFTAPPFTLWRPGVFEEGEMLRFVLHCPWASRVGLAGDWLPNDSCVELQSTLDGTYWWAQVPVATVVDSLPPSFNGDYHGARYHYLLNDPANTVSGEGKVVQDPAAGWTETTETSGWSLLVNHAGYRWQTTNWQTPQWDYLVVYQLHASRFSNRNTDAPPLLRVAKEIEDPNGYIKGLGATALLLLPLSEFPGDTSWGYGPSFFYAVENSYGGPDALKQLVDVCHQNGIAVMVDVVFNHAGTMDNILWQTARDSFFDGDTKWGSLINFDHPQCRHFFEQNLVYLKNHYHLDGFRFDHTKTIIEGGNPNYEYIRQAGSGGGWDFLHALRASLKQVDPHCIMVAEHLPNELKMTNYGGPMDSQWGDDFHDRLIDLCRGQGWRTSQFADALKYNSPPLCQQWYNITHYAESHDEVGNVNDRVASVGGDQRGLRLVKVAAAATLMSRGIPMWFMGAECGERGQFTFGGSDCLDLARYESDSACSRLRDWYRQLTQLRRDSSCLHGPSPLSVNFCEPGLLAFCRGEGGEYFVVLNFTDQPASRNLGDLNLPAGLYRELWNSSWPAFQVEWEDEHTNGGRDAYLHRGSHLNIPDNGAVILEMR